MGWQDRHYHQEQAGSGGLGGGFARRLGSRSVVTWLLVGNVVIFLLDAILTGSSRAGGLSLMRWGSYTIGETWMGLQLWRVVTYQFLHFDFFHLLFNMIGLFFFGPLLEQWFGSRRFLAFYLLCGMSGAVLFTLLAFVPGLLGTGSPILWRLAGASGSIFGILAACAVLFPRQRVMLLFPPVPMSMRTLALIFLGIAFFSLVVGARNAGGEAAHLGGALLGFVLARKPSLLNWADFGASAGPLGRMTQNLHRRRQLKKQEQIAQEEAEVDRILAKVKDHGLHSLTEREKKVLKRATQRQRWAG